MTDAHDNTLSMQATKIEGAQGTIHIARLDLEAPWRWLSAGWADLIAMPNISLTYGGAFAAIAIMMWFGLSTMGWQSLIPALGGGFMLIGPILAVGLYEASRRRELGLPTGLFSIISASFKSPGQLSLLGFALFFIFIVWLELAFLVFMLFFGDQPFPPIDAFVPYLLFTSSGIILLIVGTVVGAVLAAIAFTISVVSAPMLVARPVGIATAIFASSKAVMHNLEVMALWAVLVAGFVAGGIVTLSLGLIVIFPLIGYASWHAYQEVIGRIQPD